MVAPEASIYLTIAWKPSVQGDDKNFRGETGVLVAHARLRALLGHHQSNAFGDTNATTADQNDGVGNSLRRGGGASTCNVPVTFIMASVVGDDHDDDGMGSDEEHEEYDAE